MKLNIEKIQGKIKKVIDQLGIEVVIKRNVLNELNEPMDEPVIVCTLKGYFHKGKSSLNINLVNISDAGRVIGNKAEYLMIILDKEGQLVQEEDFFEIKGKKYKIVDLGNNFDIYNDMLLKRM